MKTRTMMRNAAFAAAAFAAIVGCSEINPYSIEAPDDLQSKIDEYAAEREAETSGDTYEIPLMPVIVGAEDNTTGWWTEWSQYFKIPANKLLTLTFVNYGSGANNWNNWNVVVTKPYERDTDNYYEYFALRSDAYGWKGADDPNYDAGLISIDYPDLDGDGDIWNDFRSYMNGATVTMKFDHSLAGKVFFSATAVSADGSVTVTESYNHPVSSTEEIWAFLIPDGSHFVMQSAVISPSEIQEEEDFDAESITVTGYPSSLEIAAEGEEVDYWGAATATVTFADGSSQVVGKDDLSFTVPDFTTTGTKTVVFSYSKTKLGNYGKSVAGYYNIEVTNSIESIAVTKAPSVTDYYFFDNTDIAFRQSGIEVTATYADGTTGVMDNSTLTFGTVPAAAGEQEVEISYAGASKTVSTTVKVNVIKGAYAIGAPDFTNGWWSTFTPEDTKIAAGESCVYEMDLYSDGLENYHSPCTILRNSLEGDDYAEYVVVRMDHFGWGAGYEPCAKESNWNWDTFKANLSGSHVTITITNNGDNTADIRYAVIYPNGEEHFQNYLGIPVDGADLNSALVTEESYLVMVK